MTVENAARTVRRVPINPRYLREFIPFIVSIRDESARVGRKTKRSPDGRTSARALIVT